MLNLYSVLKMGRFSATHFFALAMGVGASLLSGCSGLADNPVVSTLGTAIPGLGTDVSKQAKKVPYASLDFSLGLRGGLLVMAEQNQGMTFWQSSRSEILALEDGYLQSTWGIKPQLEMMRRLDDSGASISMADIGDQADYQVLVSWQDDKGAHRAGRAEAKWHCSAQTEKVELPLTKRKLHKCTESLVWDNSDKTRSVFWRDDEGHVWKADVTAWPGAPSIGWEVARPWWSLS